MLTETFPFTDFNGVQRTATLHFNLTKMEIIDLVAASPGGLDQELQSAIDKNDTAALLEFIKKLIISGYGEKSQDGLHFRKSQQIVDDFVSSAVYSDFLLSLFENGAEKGLAFIQGMLPADLVAEAASGLRDKGINPINTTSAPAQPQDHQRPAQPDHFQSSPSTGFVTGPPETRREQREESAEQGYREPIPEVYQAYRFGQKEDEILMSHNPNHEPGRYAEHEQLNNRPPFESGPGFHQN